MSTVIILVHGTWKAKWAEHDSPFRKMLYKERFWITQPTFEWSGDISGIPSLTANGKHSDWRAGGAALSYYLHGLPYVNRNVIAHSHGGNVAAYCAAVNDTPIRRLITVSTPVRDDMHACWELAKPRIGYHLHIAARRGDFTAWMGRLFDGNVQWCSWSRELPTADQNLIIPGIGHSGILADPERITLWQREHVLDLIRAGDREIGARHVG